MSPTNLHLFLSSYFTQNNWQSEGGSELWIQPGGTQMWTKAPSSVMQFWILDRTNPTGAPVFSAQAPDFQTIPSGLDKYLNPKFILVAAQASFASYLPQGELFKMLKANGGGVGLDKTELMATSFSCGVGAGLVYQLVSVPGSGLPGLENTGIRAVSGMEGTSNAAFQNSPFSMIAELVAFDENGETIYSPVEMS